MRSPIRAFLVALVTMLTAVLVFPSIAEAKSVRTRSHTTTKTTKTTKKRVVKHPWKKGHARTTAKPHRWRKSTAARPHAKKH